MNYQSFESEQSKRNEHGKKEKVYKKITKQDL